MFSKVTALAAILAATTTANGPNGSKGKNEANGPPTTFYAYCEVAEDLDSGNGVSGLLKIYQIGDLKMNIIGQIGGLGENQQHGLHIHAGAVVDGVCGTSGAHFNPFGVNHGSYANDIDARHVGDMKMLRANRNGRATYRYNDRIASLDPASDSYIGGKSFTVHALEDDLGLGGDAGSEKGGNAGARLACCNIVEIGFDDWAALDASDYLP